MKPICRLALCFLVAASAAAPGAVGAQSYTDTQLLQQGKQSWNYKQCVRAAKFLFAYRLRNPPAIQQSAEHAKAVDTAIAWCESNTMISAGAAGVDGKFDSAGVANTVAQRPQLDLDPQAPSPIINMKGWRAAELIERPLPPLALAVAARDKRCDVYARIAIAQQDANVANQCSFDGARWVSRYDHHYDWCLAVAVDATRSETDARQRLLDDCAR